MVAVAYMHASSVRWYNKSIDSHIKISISANQEIVDSQIGIVRCTFIVETLHQGYWCLRKEKSNDIFMVRFTNGITLDPSTFSHIIDVCRQSHFVGPRENNRLPLEACSCAPPSCSSYLERLCGGGANGVQMVRRFWTRRWSRKLHTVLHRESTGPALTVAAASLLNPAYIPEAVFYSHQQQDHVILATALVLVKGASGCYRLWRAVLDSCSLINFITDEFAQTLHIPRAKKIIKIRSIVVSRTQEKHSTTTSIKYRLSDFELTLDFCVTPSIAHHPNTENTSLVLTYFLEQRPFLRFCRLGKSTYP